VVQTDSWKGGCQKLTKQRSGGEGGERAWRKVPFAQNGKNKKVMSKGITRKGAGINIGVRFRASTCTGGGGKDENKKTTRPCLPIKGRKGRKPGSSKGALDGKQHPVRGGNGNEKSSRGGGGKEYLIPCAVAIKKPKVGGPPRQELP